MLAFKIDRVASGYQEQRAVQLAAIRQKLCRVAIERILPGKIRAIRIAVDVVDERRRDV